MKYCFSLLAAVMFGCMAYGQSCEDFAVELTATIQVSPAKITLHWKPLADTTTYTIYKKTKTSFTWSPVIATLSTTDSVFADTTVIADSAYEYQVLADHHNGGYMNTWEAAGYIYAATKSPAIHSKGALVLVVDSTFTDSCAAGIFRLMKDISGDGRQVIRHDVARTLNDTAVKGIIKSDYTSTANVKAVLLLGHVAVPYSGDLNPDGHPNHLGAWPADVYYAELAGAWTDGTVSDTTAGYTANRNVPGDGKWDQTVIPGITQLQVSRVDFYDMPSFAATEVQLMNSYLAKDHVYKMDSLPMRRRGIISDNFGVFTVIDSSTGVPIAYHEAFASTAWRSFPPMMSRDSVAATSALIQNLDTASYQWAYGCGGGWFSGAGGVGATTDFAANNVNGIFTILFGSYFGDWNVADNFLRAPLCSNNPGLTCCWAGRPYWFFHHMALGENIGFSAWHSQNNNGSVYAPGNIYGIQQWVHVALMGDLTLRTDYIKRASNVYVMTLPGNGANISWTASPDTAVHGYYVYRAQSEFGNYQLISGMLSTTTFHDAIGPNGLQYYMVRPVKLQATPSGNYYNLGIGITDTATVTYNHVSVAGVAKENLDCAVFPNPAGNYINVSINTDEPCVATLSLINVSGQQIVTGTKQLQNGVNTFSLQVSDLPAGVYAVMVTGGGQQVVKKWVKL